MQEKKDRNIRCKNQKYCGSPACQLARKAAWQRNKLKTDHNYKTRQKKCKHRWRKNYPANKYQHEYRIDNPDYTEDNRAKQLERNRKRAKKQAFNQSVEKIVKMDALAQESPVYQMKTYQLDASAQKIVKMDTLIVQFIAAQGLQPDNLQNSG